MNRYPKWVYSINETLTMANKKKVDDMRNKWYREAEKLLPDYFKMGIRERYEIRKTIDELVGFEFPR